MTHEEYAFLALIKNTLEKKPELLSKVQEAIQAGLLAAIDNARKDQVNWEIVASVALSLTKENRITPQHKKWAEGVFNSKIKELSSRACLSWEKYLTDDKEETKT